jgi:UDP-2,3-diacylglucosamine pyrophosphatase LpxH
MKGAPRRVYVISDLHLGGVYPKAGKGTGRGFRLSTHTEELKTFIEALAQGVWRNGGIELVLNGDTVDFLAERGDTDNWTPFAADPNDAVKKFEAIADRDAEIFTALNRFLDYGGRLVILLGNHDIELSLPPVRAMLRRRLGVAAHHDFRFIYDGEAYVVGDAVIEHGNRYDGWNQVDMDALRRVRSLASRRQEVPKRRAFDSPPGSKLVSSVINPIKEDYPFIDLLKPETEIAVPIVLALEPAYRWQLGRLARQAAKKWRHGLKEADLPYRGGDITSSLDFGSGTIGDNTEAGLAPTSSGAEDAEDEADLRALLHRVLGENTAAFWDEVEASSGSPNVGSDIAAMDGINRMRGFTAILFSRNSGALEKRLPALLKVIRAIQTNRMFSEDQETLPEYLDAAKSLARRGFRFVIFGHTHLAKRVSLGDDRWYLNSGAWADVMQFPDELSRLPWDDALGWLKTYVDKLKSADFSGWVTFRPNYIRLDVDSTGAVSKAELLPFQGSDPC